MPGNLGVEGVRELAPVLLPPKITHSKVHGD